jgi:hypothetical protein
MIDMIGVGPLSIPSSSVPWVALGPCWAGFWEHFRVAMDWFGGLEPCPFGRFYRYLRNLQIKKLETDLFLLSGTFLHRSLSIASGAIGLAGYVSFFWPGLEQPHFAHGLWISRAPGSLEIRWLVSGATFVAIGTLLIALLLLYRKIIASAGCRKCCSAGWSARSHGSSSPA